MENGQGAWVKSSLSQGEYALGRVGFSDQELTKYGIKKAVNVSEVRMSYSLLQRKSGVVEFPGAKGTNGYIVGIVLESVDNDGTNGWWCIGKQLSLGRKQMKIAVESEIARGMHVSNITCNSDTISMVLTQPY